MELAGAILACVAAATLGFSAGGKWASGPTLGALMGIPFGIVCAPLYFLVGLWIGETWPHTIDAHRLGLYSIFLVPVTAMTGAVGGWFGYRKSLGASLF